MAPSLPSCISSTFCSHRQVSWFLLATLTPFFLPFLILSVPFLLLFVAPVSCFLFSLLLLYKVQVSIRSKRLRSCKHAGKALLDEGYQPTKQIGAAERLDIHQQTPLEGEDREGKSYGVSLEFEGLEGSNAQSAESRAHHKGGDREGLCIPPSVGDFEEEKQEDIEEELAAKDGTTEDKIEQKQEEQDIIEGPLLEEDREERIRGDFPEDEGPEVSNVQNVESPASYKAGVEEGLLAPVSHSPERESNFIEEIREDMGEELLRNDMMEDKKQEEEVIDFKDEQKHFPLYVDATSSHTSEDKNWTSLPQTYDHESLDAPSSYDHQSSVPFEQQGQESLEDRNGRLESFHMHPLEEGWRELPTIPIAEPNFQAKTAVFRNQIVEMPWEDAHDEQLEMDTFTEIETQEHIREEPELSSEKDLSLGYKGMSDQKEDVFFPAEPFEREIEEGEPSCSSPEGHGQWRKETFAKEMRDDVQPQKDRPAKNLAASFEAESLAEREEGYPSEATSSAVPLPHVSHGGIEFQDRTQEEQKIMADINAIKKIVGYQSEPHASIMDQISALYMFLGMEPYHWAAEVDNFERAQVEIELLKVVVGVK